MLLRQISYGLRVLFRRAAADRELDDEVRHFIDEATAEAVVRGASSADAVRAARLGFGDVTAIREDVRSSAWEHAVETTIADVRYGLRVLGRRPGFATVAVLTLAVGVGASTAIFSAVYPVLLGPLPYPEGDRIVALADRGGDGPSGPPIDVAYGTFHEVSQRSHALSASAAADVWRPALSGDLEPERLVGALVTSQYFAVFGVQPVVGRDFNQADDRPGAPRVAIITDGLARRRFGEAHVALDKSLTLDGVSFTVVGVMPSGFADVMLAGTEVWVPRRFQPTADFQTPQWGHHMKMLARLAPGVSLQVARQDVAAIGAAPVPDFPRPPWASMTAGLSVNSLRATVTGDVRPVLLAIFAAVALLLAVAAVNVTNLLLARGAERREELAMRSALGGSRRRIVRQMLTESSVLATLGGLLGIGMAAAGVRALAALAPTDLPRTSEIGLNGAALAFALGTTTVVGLAIGLVPAFRGGREGFPLGLGSGSRTTGGSHRLRRSLVVAEIALALVLVVGAGLMVRSVTRLLATELGFTPDNVLTLQVTATRARAADAVGLRQFFDDVRDAVSHLPGVTGAAWTSQLPLTEDLDLYGVGFESLPPQAQEALPAALRYAVTPGWFSTMGIALRQGRPINEDDRPGGVMAVVISQAIADSAFPGVDPIGQRFRAGPQLNDPSRPPGIVVGVADDVKQTSLDAGRSAAFYVAMGQWPWVDRAQSLAVRVDADPTGHVSDVKQAIWSIDRDVPIDRIATMDDLVSRSGSDRRFVLIVFECFGLAAVALAAIGIFGIVSGAVTERTREFGVRAALGASRSALLLGVLADGVVLALLGIGIGVAGAALGSGTIESLLFGVSRADPTTYLSSSALILLVAILATAVPALRASRVDPSVTLRA